MSHSTHLPPPVYRASPTRSLLPDCVELSPSKYSPGRRYYPSGHPAHVPGAVYEIDKANRIAADEEDRRIEAEQRRRWAEDDADREARRRIDAEERLAWEAEQNARRDAEQRERDEFNRREQERRDLERMDRERELEERRRRDQLEREQKERDLAERKRQTEEALKQKIKDDVQDAKKYDKMMPKSYEEPQRVVAEPPRKIKKKKGKMKLFINLKFI